MTKLAAATAVLMVGGCAIGSGTRYHVDDPYQFFRYAAAHGGVPVMVVGDPYPGRRAEVEAAAVAAVQRNFPTLANAFRPLQPIPGGGTSKVVFMFNPPGAPLAAAVCQDPTNIATVPSGPRMNVGAVYCGVGPYSEAWQIFDTPPGPQSAEFRDQLTDLVFEAIPRRQDPSREYDGMNVPPN